MKRAEATDLVLELAADQWGLFAAASARDAGMVDIDLKRLVDAGVIERVHRGLYRVARFPADRWESVRVAWMVTDLATPAWERLDRDDEVVVSHTSAAELLGIGDLPAYTVELSAPRRIRLNLPVKIHVRGVPAADRTVVEGLPVTTAARTAADLAASGIDGSHLAAVVTDALDKGLASRQTLAERLAPWARHYGQRLDDGAGLIDWCLDEAGTRLPTPTLSRSDLNTLGAQLTQSPAFQEAIASQLAPAIQAMQQYILSESFANLKGAHLDSLKNIDLGMWKTSPAMTQAMQRLAQGITAPDLNLDPETVKALNTLSKSTLNNALPAGGKDRESE